MRAVTTVAFSPEEIEVFERAALAKHVGDPKSERFTEHLKFRYFTEDLTPKNRTELERFYDLLIEIRGRLRWRPAVTSGATS